MNNMSVLVVEDDVDYRIFCKICLENSGFTVIEASDAIAAFEIAKQVGKVDAIVSDYRIFGGSGLSLLEALRDAQIPMPFILMSGVKSFDTAELRKFGNVDFLLKPFTKERLLAAVNSILAV